MTAMATVTFITFTPASGANGNCELCELYLPADTFAAEEKGANETVNFVNFGLLFHPCVGRNRRAKWAVKL